MQTPQEVRELFIKELSDIYTPQEIDTLFYTLASLYLQKEPNIIRLGLNEKWPEIPKTRLMFSTAISRLKSGEPYQYVINSAPFFGMDLYVDSNVLIPRPETEELVEWIINDLKKFEKFNGNILDIGTGSGAIALALKKEFPDCTVYGIDASEKAIEVAKKNAQTQNVNINFLVQDIFKTDLTDLPYFNVIVSNPPYIPISEKDSMNKTVTQFEPETALFVPDNDPVIFYRRIADVASERLKPKGAVYVEIHQELKERTVQAFEPLFTQITERKDISGNWRMLRAQGTYTC